MVEVAFDALLDAFGYDKIAVAARQAGQVEGGAEAENGPKVRGCGGWVSRRVLARRSVVELLW